MNIACQSLAVIICAGGILAVDLSLDFFVKMIIPALKVCSFQNGVIGTFEKLTISSKRLCNATMVSVSRYSDDVNAIGWMASFCNSERCTIL